METQYQTSVPILFGRQILPVMLLLAATFTHAQIMRFDHLSVKQNLSQGNVVDIYQDKLGFIWIGTEDGLNIFDGYNFTIFRNNPDDPHSISNNNIHCVLEDKKGNLWIGTQGGLNRYNRELNHFERFVADNKPGSISNNDVVSIYFDEQNTLWAATSGGLNRYDYESRTFTKFLHDPNNPYSIADNLVKGILEDDQKRFWVATSGGLSLMRGDRKTFTNYHSKPDDPTTLSSNKVTCLYQDKNKTIWVGTFDGGLNKMNTDITFVRYVSVPSDKKTIGNNYVYGMTENSADEFWIATDGALNKMNVAEGTFTRYVQDQGNEYGLSSNIIAKVYFDRTGTMWVGTRFGGLNIYDKEKYGFQHFKYNGNETGSLNNNNVTDFEEDRNGNYWVATDGGSLNYYDHASGKFTNYLDVFSNNKILAIQKDGEGMWLGMWAGGLNYIDFRTKKVKRYSFDPNKPSSLSDNNIFDILKDKKGNIWIATWGNGLNRYNPATDDFTRFVASPNAENAISASACSILMEDSNGNIWIGTEQLGVDMFNPDTKIFKHYRVGSGKNALSSNSVFSLYEDADKKIWIGTMGGGVNMLDPKTGEVKIYTQKDGLPNNAILGILEDADHNIWMSTNKGLSRFNRADGTFKNFTESDGLQGDQYGRWAYKKLSSGVLLFGGTNGYNIFDPRNIKPNKFKPPVYITDFKIFNKPVPVGEHDVLKQNILLTKEISLDYTQNLFSFDFTALNYRQSEKNLYRYKMEGFQDEWIDLGTERKASFTNLSPGDYVFRVIGSNNDGLWNEEGASINITVVPPFWKTLWFNTLVVLAIIASIVGYVNLQKRKAKRQQAELQAIIEEKTGELKAQNEEIRKKAEAERVHNWMAEGLAEVGEIISKHGSNLQVLASETLKRLSKYVDAQQSAMAIAVKDDINDIHLRIIGSYGGGRDLGLNKRIEPGAGLMGAAYEDKEKKILANIPTDYIRIESGLGMSVPTTITLLPLKTDDGEIVGVMEMAFLNKPSDTVQQFLDKVCSVIALNIVTANLTTKTMILLQKSKEQTEELQAQEEEMRQSMEELEATTEEFRRRETEYQRRIKELEASIKERI